MPRRRYTEAQFRAAVLDPDVRSMAQLCRALDLVPRGANYESLRRYARDLGLDLSFHVRPETRPAPATRPQRRRWTDEQLLEALENPDVTGYTELCRALGLAPYHGSYARLRRRAKDLGAPIPASWSAPGPRRRRQPTPPPYTREALVAAVSGARTRKQVLHALGERSDSVAYARLRRAIARWEIDVSTLTGRAGARPLDLVLVRGKRESGLRERLLTEGVKEHRCEACCRDRWEGAPIPLELDHIDGDPTNNLIGNLRLLCPNCHARTPTYRGRNIGRTRSAPTPDNYAGERASS